MILVGILLIVGGIERLWADYSQSKISPLLVDKGVSSRVIEKSDLGNQSSSRKPPSFQTEDEKSRSEGKQRPFPQKKLVTISIHGKSTPILPATSQPYREGETALNLLISITKSRHIQMEYRGSGVTSYVTGIADLYELDYGSQSGWFYRVNGESPSVSSGACRIHSGDKVEWIYSCNLGKDVGAVFR